VKQLGPYTVLDELGRGGMGAVYLAQGQRDGEHVALKVLLETDPESVERFRREAEASREVEHPHLVRALAADFRPPHPWVAFEYVPGGTLRERVERDGPLPWEAAVQILGEVAEGVAAAHERGLLHRDVKPDNVLLAPEGAKLADFGLVKDLDRQTLTATGATLGTPEFLAPEQVGSQQEYLGPPTDVYGLSATLYFGLTGRPPFAAASAVALLTAVVQDAPTPPRRLAPGVPLWLDAVCRRGLEKHPRDRYPSALAFRAALIEESPARPRRAWILFAGLMGLGLAAGVLVSVLPAEPESPAGKAGPDVSVAPNPPTSPGAWRSEVEALLAAEDVQGAIEALERHVSSDPDAAEPQRLLMQTLVDAERFEEARRVAERALERWPEDVTLQSGLGVSLLRLGESELALQQFELAVTTNPDVLEPHLLLAELLWRQARLERALSICDRAVELDTRSGRAYLLRSKIQHELGDVEGSLRDIRRALRAGLPHDVESTLRTQLHAYEDRSLGRSQASGLRRQLAETEASLESAPRDPGLHVARGELLAALGRLEQSLEALERASELDPDDPVVHAKRGQVLGELEQPSEALAAWTRAIALDPDHAPLYVQRALLLARVGRGEEALDDLERALDFDPRNPTTYLMRCQVHYTLQRYADAIADAEAALELGLPDPEAERRARTLRDKARTKLGPR